MSLPNLFLAFDTWPNHIRVSWTLLEFSINRRGRNYKFRLLLVFISRAPLINFMRRKQKWSYSALSSFVSSLVTNASYEDELYDPERWNSSCNWDQSSVSFDCTAHSKLSNLAFDSAVKISLSKSIIYRLLPITDHLCPSPNTSGIY